jgi:hypothetical protein
MEWNGVRATRSPGSARLIALIDFLPAVGEQAKIDQFLLDALSVGPR